MTQLNKQEQGRSMVEMLGVLAVIGVLSVAGIAGYSVAMRNHRTNEVLNAASMLYVMAMAKNQGTGADTNYTELGTPPSGTTLAYTVSDKKITITFPNTEDCTIAANKLGDKATADCSNKKLTVNFGETSVEEADNNDYNLDYQSQNTPCTGSGYVCGNDDADNCVFYCVNDKWQMILTPTDHAMRCYDGCIDHKKHPTPEATCIDGNYAQY